MVDAAGTGGAAGDAVLKDLAPLTDLVGDGPRQYVEHDGLVRLIGSESRSSGVRTFPAKLVCPETGARDMREFSIGPGGRLYAFSEVHVSASRATPYTIGYVDFPEGVRVLCQVKAAGGQLSCDIDVELRAEGDSWFVTPVSAED